MRPESPTLTWWPKLGYGYFPVDEFLAGRQPYDERYWERYHTYVDTEIGRALNEARVELVKRHWPGQVVDVGIGSGQFIEAHGNARGYDICAPAVRWLCERELFSDPGAELVEAVTCWDSLEHFRRPQDLLDRVLKWAFISMPVYQSAEDALNSRHFRPDEHYWYFTREGFERWASGRGWMIVEFSRVESELGRDSIGSWALKRNCDVSAKLKHPHSH